MQNYNIIVLQNNALSIFTSGGVFCPGSSLPWQTLHYLICGCSKGTVYLVPENIHIPPTEGNWKFLGVRGFSKKCVELIGISRGVRSSYIKSLPWGAGVWIILWKCAFPVRLFTKKKKQQNKRCSSRKINNYPHLNHTIACCCLMSSPCKFQFDLMLCLALRTLLFRHPSPLKS